MNRVLVVGEQSQTSGLRDALGRHAHRWQLQFAASTADAMTALAANPFDVVIADIGDPKSDELALLERIKAEHPEAVRIILSRPGDRAAVMRVLPVSHQFVAKPCEPEQLWKIVERSCCINRLMGNAQIRRLLGGLDRLPSVPRSYAALTQAMGQEDVPLSTIVGIVERDTAMAAKVLQLVNSAYFGRSRPVSSIPVTISLLGLERLKALALSCHVFGMLGEAESKAYGLEQLQERALRTAQLARRFLFPTGRGDEGFTAGLLQNVGKLVLAVCLKDRYREVVGQARQRGVPVQAVEQERFQTSHAEVGAYLLSLWGLPATIVEAVAFHHAPGSVLHDDTAVVDAVHVADVLVDHMMDVGGPAPEELMVDPILMTRPGMDEKIQQWRAIANEEQRGIPA